MIIMAFPLWFFGAGHWTVQFCALLKESFSGMLRARVEDLLEKGTQPREEEGCPERTDKFNQQIQCFLAFEHASL